MENIKQAFDIAKQNLRGCYGKRGIFAGLHQFKDYWTRDSCFASLGSIAIKDYGIVKKNLKLFLDNIDADGQIPLKVGGSHLDVIFGYFGIELKGKKKAYYNNDKTEHKTIDQNSLVAISLYEYARASKDKKFLEEHIAKIERAIKWDLSMDSDGDFLIEEEPFCNWADSLRKRGEVIYTNACHCHALKCTAEMFSMLRNKKKYSEYIKLYEKTRRNLDREFWNGKYYVDFIDGDRIYDNFSTDGNSLAVAWGIASGEKALSIVETAEKLGINDVPSGCVYPLYGPEMTAPLVKVLGLADYHNGLSWLWLGSMMAMANHKAGRKAEAVEILGKIADIILKHGKVYEVYTDKGNPVRRFRYRSERPFAWSSGLYVYAVREIMKIS